MPHTWQPSRSYSADMSAGIARVLMEIAHEMPPESLLRFATEQWPRVPNEQCVRAVQIVIELTIIDYLFEDSL